MADRPLIAAHRGSTTGAPENTLAAIRWASDSGADLIETDVRLTADGSLVLIHDELVNRTTDGLGRVAELTLRDLQALDAGAGERVPTLEEAMGMLAGRPQHLLLDVKADDPRVVPRLVDAVAAQGFEDRVLVGVRSLELLADLRGLAPQLRILAMVPDTASLQDFLHHEPDGVRLWARWAEREPGLISAVRNSGAQVWIMAGQRLPDRLRDLVLQVDGFITDRPVELREFAEFALDRPRR
ncbi:MAG TPA: glycerophosphodiester phosphodiesterase family protein [Pseudomonadales bacterium]